jgi:hypothetical protein
MVRWQKNFPDPRLGTLAPEQTLKIVLPPQLSMEQSALATSSLNVRAQCAV